MKTYSSVDGKIFFGEKEISMKQLLKNMGNDLKDIEAKLLGKINK